MTTSMSSEAVWNFKKNICKQLKKERDKKQNHGQPKNKENYRAMFSDHAKENEKNKDILNKEIIDIQNYREDSLLKRKIEN